MSEKSNFRSEVSDFGLYLIGEDAPDEEDGRKIWHIKAESEGGQALTIRMNGRPLPLNFEELFQFSIHRTCVPLRFTAASYSHTGSTVEEEQRGDIVVQWAPAAARDKPVFLLTEGGWLPAGPWVNAEFLIMDRNIVIDLEKLVAKTDRDLDLDLEPERVFWFDLLRMTNTKIHPFVFGLEGRVSRRPEMAEFLDEIARANSILEAFFGTSAVVKLDVVRQQGAAGLLRDLKTYLRKAHPFLRKVLPLLHPSPKSARHESIYRTILEAANEFKLGQRSMLVLLAVSLLFQGSVQRTPESKLNPGRLILKPKSPFTDKALYNASFDAWLIELLAGGNALSASGIVLVTQDKGLVSFWAGLQPSNLRMENRVPTANIQFVRAHFPAMPDELFIDFSARFQ